MILFILELLSVLSIIAYYGLSTYLTLKSDAVNGKVIKYAWYHLRDKWSKKITDKSLLPPSNIVLSHDGKIIAFNREVKSKNGKDIVKQIYKISAE